MRITKQASGGRGEYELVDYAPDGSRPADLLGLAIKLVIGPYVVDTQIHVPFRGGDRQGKYRLRLINPRGGYPHIQMQIAGILLLPHPIREEEKVGSGEPVFQNDSYIIKNINIDSVVSTDGSMLRVV